MYSNSISSNHEIQKKSASSISFKENHSTGSNLKPESCNLKPGWSYPPSVQVDLFNYLKPHQQKALKPYLRIVKRPYQEKLCTSLLDYLEGNGLDTLTEPVLATLQEEIVRTCGLKPLRVDSRFRIHDSREPMSVGAIIKNLFPNFSNVSNRPKADSNLER